MKRRRYRGVIVALLATFGVVGVSIGSVDSAEAGWHGHDSRDSLAGRSFLVKVKNLDDNSSFENCYIFEEDGTWIDPLFISPDLLFPGTWVQHTGGLVSRYTAFARIPTMNPLIFGDDVSSFRLIQNGTVTRVGRSGKLRLIAYSTGVFETFNPETGEYVEFSGGNFLSKGFSVDSCD